MKISVAESDVDDEITEAAAIIILCVLYVFVCFKLFIKRTLIIEVT